MANKKLVIDVRLDTQKAKADQKNLAKDIKEGSKKINEGYDSTNKKLLGFSDLLKKTAATGKQSAESIKEKFKAIGAKVKETGQKVGNALATGFKKGGAAAVALGVAVVGLKKTLEELTTLQSEEARGKIFGASVESAKALNKELGFALSQREALQEVAKLKGAGFSDEEVQSAAKLVRPLEVMGLLSKQAALEIARTGNVSEETLNAFGLSTQQVDYKMQGLQASTGMVPRQLDRARIVTGLLAKQAEKYRQTWEKVGTTSPIDRLFARLKDLKDTVFRKFAEAVDKNARVFDTIAQYIPKIATGIVDATVALSKMGSRLKAILDDSEFFQSFLRGFDVVYNFIMKKMDKDYVKPLTSGLAKEIANEIESVADSQGLKKAVEKTLTKTKKKRTIKRPSLEQQEAQSELLGKQSEFRNQMRNFLQFYLNNLATLGGALSGVISASKDLPEQLKVLTSNKDAVRAMKETKGLTEEQIILKLKEKKLDEQQVKAVLLLKQIEKAGKFDLDEKIRNQEVVTKELMSQALLSERMGQIAAFQKQAKDIEIEIEKSQKLLKLSILGIDLQRFELQQKQNKAKRKNDKEAFQQQINSLDTMKKRFVESNKTFQKQQKLQSESIDLAKWRIEYAKDILDPLTAQAEKEKAITSIKWEKLAIEKETAAIYGKQDEFQNKIIASLQKEDDLKARIEDLRIQRMKAALDSQIAMAIGDKAEIKIARMKEKSLINQIKGTKGLLSSQQELTEALNNQSQPLGRFVTGFRSAFQTIQGGIKHLAQTFGEAWGKVLTTGLGGLQTFVSEYFKSLVSMEKVDWGQKLGQGFLELLSGIAAQFGAVMTAVGAGYIAMGNVGQGIATLAAAGGLYALAGLLGGLSSISEKKKGGSTKGNSKVSTPPPSIAAPNAPERKEREVFVIINSAPFLGDQGEQARKFAKWAKQNKRVLGAVMP